MDHWLRFALNSWLIRLLLKFLLCAMAFITVSIVDKTMINDC